MSRFKAMIATATVISIILFVAYNLSTRLENDSSLLEDVVSQVAGNNLVNCFGVEGIDDIKFYRPSKDKIEIGYGDIRLRFSEEDLQTERVVDLFSKLGIEFKIRKDNDEVVMFFKGEAVSEYIK